MGAFFLIQPGEVERKRSSRRSSSAIGLLRAEEGGKSTAISHGALTRGLPLEIVRGLLVSARSCRRARTGLSTVSGRPIGLLRKAFENQFASLSWSMEKRGPFFSPVAQGERLWVRLGVRSSRGSSQRGCHSREVKSSLPGQGLPPRLSSNFQWSIPHYKRCLRCLEE